MSKKKRYFTLLLLSASLFGPSPTVAFAQHQVVIEAKSETLTSVLKRLERLSGYKVMYANDDVAGVKVNASVNTTDVRAALDQILKGTGLTYTIDKQFVTIKKVPFAGASAQKGEAFIMEGHVYDESGLDVPGVTVMIVGTDKGTATDIDGRFSLKVRAGDKLKFSYIGYTNVIEEVRAVNNRKVMKVFIKPDSKSIDEVQVVAFGTQKKESVVASITTVKPGDLKTSSSDLTTAFAGKIPGMIAWQTGGLPGALSEDEMNTKFYVRGITSFQSGANTDPLILIDGVESSKLDLSRIAVEDIETFSVLKDASATAMYGARGANGVIMVTTKKGTEGSVYTTMRYESIVSQPTQDIDIVDPVTYMKAYNQALLGRSPEATPLYTVERINRTQSGKYPSWVYPATDWYKMLFKDLAWNHHAGLNIRGGSSKVQYYAALNYNRDEGMVKSNKLNDFSSNIINNEFQFRSNLNIDLMVGMKLQINSVATLDKYHGPLAEQSQAYAYVFNASPVDFSPTYPADEEHNWPHTLYGTTLSNKVNPYALIQAGYKDRTRYNTQNRVELQHKLSRWVKGLEYRLSLSYVQTGYYENSYTTIPYMYALTNYDFETGLHTLYATNPTKGRRTLEKYSNSNSTDTRVTYTGTVLHTAAWGGKEHNLHQTSLTGVVQMQDRTFTPVSSVLNGQPQRNLTFSGRASYGFMSRYFAEASFGYNGSERFDKHNRFGFFPAVGTAWIVTDEPWMKKARSWLNFLKVRLSYGKVGNDGIVSTPRFVFLPTLDKVEMGLDVEPGSSQTLKRNRVVSYANTNIKWEVAEQSNLGLEMKLLKGEIELQADIYKEYRHNIISYRTNIPASMGIEVTPLDNIGETYSRGLDLSAKYQKAFSSDIYMILNGTLTYNKVTYKKIEEATDKPYWQLRKGKEISQPLAYIAEGLFRDQAEIDNSPQQDGDVMPGDIKYRDLNGDGVINVNDATFVGFPETPRLVYGFSGFFNVKQFEFSFSFQGSGQRSFFINSYAVSPFVNDHALLQAIYDDHWSEDNQALHPFWPRLSTENIAYHNPEENWGNPDNGSAETRKSTYFLRNCSFLRCTSIELAYNIPMKLLKPIGFKNLKLYGRVNNAFCLTNFRLWDVELGSNGFNYPIQRTWSLGVNLSF